MHWHTGKSIMNTLGTAVEQLAGCLAKQASHPPPPIPMGIHSAMNIQITKQIGVGSMGGVVITLTRGWANG